jgi:hypothetical protein
MFNTRRIQKLEKEVNQLGKDVFRLIDIVEDLTDEVILLKDYLKVEVQDSITLKKIVKKK